MTSLVHSPWAPHHYHKTGLYFSGGSETSSSAQNVQTVYSFLRGSAKQYGLTVYGQACVPIQSFTLILTLSTCD